MVSGEKINEKGILAETAREDFIKNLLLGKCFINEILQSRQISTEIFSVITEATGTFESILRVLQEIQELDKTNEKIKKLLRDYVYFFISPTADVKILNGVNTLLVHSECSFSDCEIFNYYQYVSEEDEPRKKSLPNFNFMKLINPNGEKVGSSNLLVFNPNITTYYRNLYREFPQKVLVAYEPSLILRCADLLDVNVEKVIEEIKREYGYGATGIGTR